jgi:hypothetical protein
VHRETGIGYEGSADLGTFRCRASINENPGFSGNFFGGNGPVQFLGKDWRKGVSTEHSLRRALQARGALFTSWAKRSTPYVVRYKAASFMLPWPGGHPFH